MPKDRNDNQTTDLFNSEPFIMGLGAVSSKLKGKDLDNTIEFVIKGTTNVNDTAMLKTPVWCVAVAEWLCRICEEDVNEAHRALVRNEGINDDSTGNKGLDSTGLVSVKLKSAEIEAVFSCNTVMEDIMRLSNQRVSGMVARWLLALCNGDLYDAKQFVNDGYLRIIAEQYPVIETRFRLVK